MTTMTKKTGFIRRERATEGFAGLFLNGSEVPSDVVFSYAAGGSNVSEVTIKVANKDGYAISGVHVLTLVLSDAATGIGLTGTEASGTVQAKSGCGTVLGVLTTKKAIVVSTIADGTFVLEITDTDKHPYYIAVSHGVMPSQVSRALATGDFG
jgi:hypothetical protein